jgi:hypothetical protein
MADVCSCGGPLFVQLAAHRPGSLSLGWVGFTAPDTGFRCAPCCLVRHLARRIYRTVTAGSRGRHRSASPSHRFYKRPICHLCISFNTIFSIADTSDATPMGGETMSRRRIRSVALAGAGAAAFFATVVALSPTASADPMSSSSPPLPGIDVVRQFASAAGIPQALQNAASALSGTPATGATQAGPSPLASASVSVPQLPLPGTAPQNGLAGVVPAAASPLSLPTDLTSIMSSLGAMSAASAPGGAASPMSPMSALP